MSNNLDPQKEEEIKALLKTDSIREITKKTGMAKNTIARIRNGNFTEEEKARLKVVANIKGRHKRELEKGDPTMEEEQKEERLCKECGEPTGRKSALCKKCYLKQWHKENDVKSDLKPKRKYTRHSKPKKKLLPAVRHQETAAAKMPEMFKALRRAILLDFLEEIGRQL